MAYRNGGPSLQQRVCLSPASTFEGPKPPRGRPLFDRMISLPSRRPWDEKALIGNPPWERSCINHPFGPEVPAKDEWLLGPRRRDNDVRTVEGLIEITSDSDTETLARPIGG